MNIPVYVFYIVGICLLACATIFVVMKIQMNHQKKQLDGDIVKYKKMLSDRMELESEGLEKLKKEIEAVKKENENFRISIQTYSQKPGRKELQRLNVYQTAVDRLIINSPGFGAAWQAAIKESEEEFEKTYVGLAPFIRKIIPMKTDANIVKEIEE